MISKQQFFTKYYPDAYRSSLKSKISPLVILSQAYLESGAGKSILASKYNNFFGVKADKSWNGKVVIMKTREVEKGVSKMKPQPFRHYDTAEQSFDDHAKFLMKNPRYGKSGLFNPNNSPAMQIDSIANAGYATDPNYAKVLKDILGNFASVKNKLVKANKMPTLTNGNIVPVLVIPLVLFVGYLLTK